MSSNEQIFPLKTEAKKLSLTFSLVAVHVNFPGWWRYSVRLVLDYGAPQCRDVFEHADVLNLQPFFFSTAHAQTGSS